MKLAIDPRADFGKAPGSVKGLYLTLVAISALWLVAQVIATVNGGNVFALLGNVLLAYLVIDSGLVVLRGKSMGLGLARFWAALAVVLGGLAVAGIYAPGGADAFIVDALGLVGVAALVLSFLPATRTHFDARRGEKLVDLKAARTVSAASQSSPDGARKSGSWDDLLASEDEV